eukprot:gene4816-3458_t
MATIGTLNETGESVDLYIPRKCHATNSLITSYDYSSVQIAIANVDASGIAEDSCTIFCIAGFVRSQGRSDHAINHLAIEHGLLRIKSAKPKSKKAPKKKVQRAAAAAPQKGRAAAAPQKNGRGAAAAQKNGSKPQQGATRLMSKLFDLATSFPCNATRRRSADHVPPPSAYGNFCGIRALEKQYTVAQRRQASPLEGRAGRCGGHTFHLICILVSYSFTIMDLKLNLTLRVAASQLAPQLVSEHNRALFFLFFSLFVRCVQQQYQRAMVRKKVSEPAMSAEREWNLKNGQFQSAFEQWKAESRARIAERGADKNQETEEAYNRLMLQQNLNAYVCHQELDRYTACLTDKSLLSRVEDPIAGSRVEINTESKANEKMCRKTHNAYTKCLSSRANQETVLQNAVMQPACSKKKEELLRCMSLNNEVEVATNVPQCSALYRSLIRCGLNHQWDHYWRSLTKFGDADEYSLFELSRDDTKKQEYMRLATSTPRDQDAYREYRANLAQGYLANNQVQHPCDTHPYGLCFEEDDAYCLTLSHA